MTDPRKATDTLLAMYAKYKAVSEQESIASTALAKAKLSGKPTGELLASYNILKEKLQRISDSMTFESPMVWMMYKFEAYAHEAQPISTMHDFRVHCSKPGYICTKRYEFVNQELSKRNLTPLSKADKYPDHLALSEAIDSPDITKLAMDEDFQALWATYEYHKQHGRVAKWENYIF